MHSSDTISMMERNISKEVHYGSSMLQHLSLPWDMRQTTMSLSKAHGGGLAGQAQLGVARALLKVSANHRTPLKQEGLLTRDSRVVERKKVGLKKARNAPQYSKR